ncbi:MAG TPA: XrtB/PEP-CTERM-associated polysaccharide biosynthesis outer membrane protein EpsL [Povalibacter sp.]|nr:XrtB/PEP-CTERM-associated polysaccharide biosynthesis outer membrane protein EpsL [Povalibacter sp.]
MRAMCALGVPALLAAGGAVAAPSPDTASDPLKIILMDRYLYDDNLFRVPDGFFAVNPDLVPPQSLRDYINRASVGLRVRLDESRQVFHADIRLDDVRYQRNDDLNYTGGNADLMWDWQFASEWSGKLYGTFDRSQASLANYTFFGRDIVDTSVYGLEVRYGFAGRWRLLAAAAAADTNHDADIRRIENYEATTGRGGVEYVLPSGSVFALEYRVTNADFPVAEDLAGSPQGYKEQEPAVRVEYVYSEKTKLTLHVGYLNRDYDNPASGDYSGETWSAAMEWEPRSKLKFDIEAWHELKAYADAQSDYFVADGISITPEWEPTTMLKLSAALSYEKQDYIGNGFVALPDESSRKDKVKGALFTLDYTPRDFFSLGLAYRTTDRSSNRDFRAYDDNMASVQVKFIF